MEKLEKDWRWESGAGKIKYNVSERYKPSIFGNMETLIQFNMKNTKSIFYK